VNKTYKQTILAGAMVIALEISALPGMALASIKGGEEKTSLKSSALVSQSAINADCLVMNDCSATIRNELAGIQLGHIPDPLGELVLEEKELRRKLGKFASRLELPEKVVIKRQGALLKGSEVKAKIKSLCQVDGKKNIEIDVSRVPGTIVLPGNLIDWQIESNSDNQLGMRLFCLTAQTDGGSFRQLIQVNVAQVIEAAQLTRLVKPGELVTKEMINKKRVELKSERANLPISYEEAVGKCLARFKSPGTILRSSDLSTGENNICVSKAAKPRQSFVPAATAQRTDRENWAIKPGDKVDFHFANGTLALTMPARAVEGGEIGDEISLINLKNRQRVHGIIVDKGRVEYAKN
jgi:flagella basal body P-ring formation protein FlgA